VRLSLSTRIFLAHAVIVTAFGAAALYGLATVTSLRHELGFLRQGALPLLDELRSATRELKGFDEALARTAPVEIEWVTRLLPSAEPFERVERLADRAAALARSQEAPPLARMVSADPLPLADLEQRLRAIRTSASHTSHIAQNVDLLRATGTVPALDGPPGAYAWLVRTLAARVQEGRFGDAAAIAGEARRVIRSVQRDLGEAERSFVRALDQRFELAALNEERAALLVVVSSAVALGVSVLILLVMVWTLRPIRRLTDVVRRFAGGEGHARAQARGATEIALLAEEWNRMADRLRERELLLTQQREEVSRLERLATLGQVTARITHEVRNPLSSIGLNAEMLEEELAEPSALRPEEARTLVRAISQEVERLRGVTEQYLRHARRPVAERSSEDIASLVRSLVDFVRAEIEARAIDLRLDLPDELVAEVDGPKLRQALLNLLRNAWEAMPRGGRIEIRVQHIAGTDESPESVQIAVEDDGPGLAANVVERAFEPFYSTKDRGTGLGLAVVREIVSAHGGHVSAGNRPAGGAAFVMVLPLRDPA